MHCTMKFAKAINLYKHLKVSKPLETGRELKLCRIASFRWSHNKIRSGLRATRNDMYLIV